MVLWGWKLPEVLYGFSWYWIEETSTASHINQTTPSAPRGSSILSYRLLFSHKKLPLATAAEIRGHLFCVVGGTSAMAMANYKAT
jgi:hypothetical protein